MVTITRTKDPVAKLDYGWDWEDWLAGDTIDTSTWTVPTTLVKESDSKTNTTTTVWISGGTLGESYTVTNQIVTAAGRVDQRSFVLKIVDY